MSKKAPKTHPNKKPTQKRSPRGVASAPLSTNKEASEAEGESVAVQSKGGRPAKYSPEFARQAEKLCLMGATDRDLAEFFEVTNRTIIRWRVAHKEFCHSLKVGKTEADQTVERSLYHKATGYTFDSEKVFQFNGEIVRAKTVEHVTPDTTAMIFWLKNRKPEQWRDRIEHTGKDGDPLPTPAIYIMPPSGNQGT